MTHHNRMIVDQLRGQLRHLQSLLDEERKEVERVRALVVLVEGNNVEFLAQRDKAIGGRDQLQDYLRHLQSLLTEERKARVAVELELERIRAERQEELRKVMEMFDEPR